jgi:hypothetical protein
LIRPDRKDRGRVTAFLAVIVLHFVAALLVLSGSEIHIPKLRPEQDMTLTFLPSATPRHSAELAQPPAPANPSSANKRQATLAAGPKPAVPDAAAEPSNAITLPFIDWDAEAQAEARRKEINEETERQRRNLAGPSAAQLEWWKHNAPSVRDHHELGDTERAAGGEVITWLNDRCFYTTKGIATFGMPQTSKVCKDPPKPETHLFQDMRKQLDEREISSTP